MFMMEITGGPGEERDFSTIFYAFVGRVRELVRGSAWIRQFVLGCVYWQHFGIGERCSFEVRE